MITLDPNFNNYKECNFINCDKTKDITIGINKFVKYYHNCNKEDKKKTRDKIYEFSFLNRLKLLELNEKEMFNNLLMEPRKIILNYYYNIISYYLFKKIIENSNNIKLLDEYEENLPKEEESQSKEYYYFYSFMEKLFPDIVNHTLDNILDIDEIIEKTINTLKENFGI